MPIWITHVLFCTQKRKMLFVFIKILSHACPLAVIRFTFYLHK